MKSKWQRALPRTAALALLFCLLEAQSYFAVAQNKTARATITIDGHSSVGPISPLLYGQFMEFMFEGVKFGLHAELLRNRSFEEPPNVIGLSRYWERHPDKPRSETQIAEHSLRVDVSDGAIQRHGVFQDRVPVRGGMEYQGYLWLKTTGYEGRVT